MHTPVRFCGPHLVPSRGHRRSAELGLPLCLIRDAAFSVYALRRIGLTAEASSFLGWVLDAVERDGRPRVLYDLDGGTAWPNRGRLDEAAELFDSLCNRANPLGLLPEEIDPGSGAFLGNYPQAFSHVGVISSGINLARMMKEAVR